jgi:hypothetical protein
MAATEDQPAIVETDPATGRVRIIGMAGRSDPTLTMHESSFSYESMTIPEAFLEIQRGVAQALEIFSNSIGRLNSTIERMDSINDLRYKTLMASLNRMEERVEESVSKMASQSSLDNTKDDIHKDIKVLGENINTIMEYMKPRGP